MAPLVSKSLKDPFQQAELLVPELVDILRSSEEANKKEATASGLVQHRLIDNAESQEAVYLGCLLKAYLHVLTHEAFPPENLETDIHQFIQGKYDVCGTYSIWVNKDGEIRRPEAQLVPKELIDGSGATKDVIAIHQANLLAFTGIFECELAKQFGNKETAKKLATSTARLLVPRHNFQNKGFKWTPDNQLENLEVLRSQKIFAQSLLAEKCNPFENTRVLEFAGYDDAIDLKFTDSDEVLSSPCHRSQPFPMIRLFKQYRDYTPSNKYAISVHDPNRVTLSEPGAFFKSAHGWGEDEKFDYVIACNVFCDGAMVDSTHRDAGYLAYQDLIPHFANCAKDQGKVIISNVQVDPLEVADDLNIQPPEKTIATWAGLNFHSASSNDHLVMLERDYSQRPNIPATYEEIDHDSEISDTLCHTRQNNAPQELTLRNKNGIPLTYIEKLEAAKDEAIKRGAGAGWDVDM